MPPRKKSKLAQKCRERVARIKSQLKDAKLEAKQAKQELKRKAQLLAAASSEDEVEKLQPLLRYPLVKVSIEKEDTVEASPEISSPETYGPALATAMILRLPNHDMHALWVCLKFLGPLPVGTACAGTDCPILGLHCIAEAAKATIENMFGPTGFSIRHEFSSEIDTSKRKFIEHMVSPGQSFGDVGDLSAKKAKNHKAASGDDLELIARIKLLFAGFICKDVSTMNVARTTHRRCIENLQGKTGGTFSKILDYGLQHGSDEEVEWGFMWLLENVLGLATPPRGANGKKLTVHDSNLSAVLAMLSQRMSHTAFAFQLDPRLYGHPQSRTRLFIPSFRNAFLKKLKCDPGDMYDKVKECVILFSNGYGRVSLDKLLLPPSHPLVLKYYSDDVHADKPAGGVEASTSAASSSSGPPTSSATAEATASSTSVSSGADVAACSASSKAKAKCKAKPKPGPKSGPKQCVRGKPKVAAKPAANPKWLAQHAEFADQRNIDWASRKFTVTPELKAKYPGISAMTDRERDVLALKGATLSEKRTRLLDLGQSVGRSGPVPSGSKAQTKVGCCTPKQRLWITSQNRFAIGAELLNFQGINYTVLGLSHDSMMAKYPNGLLADLAGNAFHGGCSIAITLAMLTAVGHAIVARDQIAMPGASGIESIDMSSGDAAAALDAIWDARSSE